MVQFEKGAWFWFETENESWVPVRMVSNKGGSIMAETHGKEQFTIPDKAELDRVNESSLKWVDNMVDMEELSEPAILHNLRLRFEENLIYTYISSILVSANPFKLLPIYSPAIMAEYRDQLSKGNKMDPHCYALSDACFKALSIQGEDQSVIISGESGAGKTEATKLVLQYMAEMSGQSSEVEQQLLEANPVVEAFGNAKTVRNNNSSRFGKWIEITFDSAYHIAGARLINYLLEKSRIVEPGKGERNYHIFYQLCKGATDEEKVKYKLDEAATFTYAAIGECIDVPVIDDVREFQEMKNALNVLKFEEDEISFMFKVTSAVLHLGNVEFKNGSGDKAEVVNMDVMQKVCELIECDSDQMSKSLCAQSRMMGREKILTFLDKDKAEANRDALAKTLYGNMFNWLILRINKTLFKTVEKPSIVGVLDIFGFEIFETNRFEQFCINFANEKMQQHFNEHIFTMEQNEYISDKIDVAHVDFIDNQPCLDVIETGKQCILAMVDEELRLPKGSDANLLERMHGQFKKSDSYIAPKKREPHFTINHYAGPVTYVIEQFMQKNLDKLGVDASETVKSSKLSLVTALIPEGKGAKTLGHQFKTQLADLMSTLKKTAPSFIRCIKSNNQKVADTFDGPMVLRQLRYLGLKDVVNIRQLGYPIRRLHKDFFDRYNLVTPGCKWDPSNGKQSCIDLLAALGCPEMDWRVGDTKVFIRNNVQLDIEKQREKCQIELVVSLQCLARAKVWRERYMRLKNIETELKKAVEGDDSDVLEDVIERYEGLQMNLNPKLLQLAVARRNHLIKYRAAERALKFAKSSWDIDVMKAAVDQVREVKIEGKHVDEMEQKYQDVAKYKADQKKVFDNRDLELCRDVVARIAVIGIPEGPLEKQTKALLTQLEEDVKNKARLKEAMASRDLEALKKALQIALKAKSGAMIGSALERAKELGLDQDPVFLSAMTLQTTLEVEVSVKQMTKQVENAMSTNDIKVIESTLAKAREMNVDDKKLVKATQLLAELKRKEAVLNSLRQAIDSRDTNNLQAAIAAAKANKLENSAECKEAQRFIDESNAALAKLEEVQKKAAEVKAKQAIAEAAGRKLSIQPQYEDGTEVDDALTAALALGLGQKTEGTEGEGNTAVADAAKVREDEIQRSAIKEALERAVEARNLALLQSALDRAREQKLTSLSVFEEASNLYSELLAEQDYQEQELENAEAAEKAEEVNVGREAATSAAVIDLPPAPSPPAQEENKPKDPNGIKFDATQYSEISFRLSKFSDLRPANDFVAGIMIGAKKKKLGMLKFSKDALPTTLTKIENLNIVNEGIAVFKNIQGFMGDRHYSFPDGLVSEVIEKMLDFPSLRTESYVQVLKQLDGNPKECSGIKGWQLLCLLAENIAPDANFLYYLLYFLNKNAQENSNQVIQGYAKYAMCTLEDTINRGLPAKPSDRGAEPICRIEHVSAFRERTMLGDTVRITLPDASEIELTIDPWNNALSCISMVAEKIGMSDVKGMAFFETKNGSITSIEDEECLLDFQHSWSKAELKQKIVTKNKSRFKFFSKKTTETITTSSVAVMGRFLFARRIYGMPIGQSNCPVMNKMMALQAARDLATGCGAYELDVISNIAACAKVIYQSSPRIGSLETQTEDAWAKVSLWSKPSVLKVDNKKYDQTVEGYVSKWQGEAFSPKLLDLCRTLPLFGAQHFNVESSDPQWQPLVIMSVNFYGVYLLSRNTREELAHFPLMSIMGWSSTPLRVVLMVKLAKKRGNINHMKCRFKTQTPRMAREICSLLFCYATEMMKAIKIQKAAKSVKA